MQLATNQALQWLLQAHLSTESYHDAAVGLKRVRRFRRFTHWIRYPSTLVVLLINNSMSACNIRKTSERKVLVWSKESRYRPSVRHTIMRLATDVQHLPFQQPVDSPQARDSHDAKKDEVNTLAEEIPSSHQPGRRGEDRALLARSLSMIERTFHPSSISPETSPPPEASQARQIWDEEKGERDDPRRT